MYDLAPRFNRTITGTSANVGPGTYILCSPKETSKNCAPFLTNAPRKVGLHRAPYTEAIYFPKKSGEERIKGGASIIYTAQRTKLEEDTPGPASYNGTDKRSCKRIPRYRGKGKLYVCKVPFTVGISTPSCPTRIDENGYDVDEFGNLYKVPPTQYDPSEGPACYNVPYGWSWSKSKVSRFIKPSDLTPGVGDYNIDTTPVQNPTYLEIREMARLLSFLPRYSEAQMLKAEKEGFPGPADYDYKESSFHVKQSMSVVPKPFLTAEKRFQNFASLNTPSPVDYCIPKQLSTSKHFSVRRVSFNAASRWKQKRRDQIPGPNVYVINNDNIDDKLRKKTNKYSCVNPPFLTTTKRKVGFLPDTETPGPADYETYIFDFPKEVVQPVHCRPMPRRFQESSHKKEAGPGSYNVAMSFEKSCLRKSHNVGKVPFCINAARSKEASMPTAGQYYFLKIVHVYYKSCNQINLAKCLPNTVKLYNDCPSDYVSRGTTASEGLSFYNAARFKQEDITPGPADYSVIVQFV
ncbi:hypothetical protein FQA39_LY05096 [Lamprigera yunnana]|nr:hypothetical protein FQA39_LY05096 [Lamprigera yunnana]